MSLGSSSSVCETGRLTLGFSLFPTPHMTNLKGHMPAVQMKTPNTNTTLLSPKRKWGKMGRKPPDKTSKQKNILLALVANRIVLVWNARVLLLKSPFWF